MTSSSSQPQENPALSYGEGVFMQMTFTPLTTALFGTVLGRLTAKQQVNVTTPLLYAVKSYGFKVCAASGKNVPIVVSQHKIRDEKMVCEEATSKSSGNILNRLPTVIFASAGGFALTHPFSTFSGIANVNKTTCDQLSQMAFWKKFPQAYTVAPGMSLLSEFSNTIAYLSAVEGTQFLSQYIPKPAAYAVAFPVGILMQTYMSTVSAAVSNHIYVQTKVAADKKLLSPGSWPTFCELWKKQNYKVAVTGSSFVALRIGIIYTTVEVYRKLTEALITKSWSAFFKSATFDQSKEEINELQNKVKLNR